MPQLLGICPHTDERLPAAVASLHTDWQVPEPGRRGGQRGAVLRGGVRPALFVARWPARVPARAIASDRFRLSAIGIRMPTGDEVEAWVDRVIMFI